MTWPGASRSSGACGLCPSALGLVLILVAATLAPMVPLVFLAFPMDTLLELAARLIFGL